MGKIPDLQTVAVVVTELTFLGLLIGLAFSLGRMNRLENELAEGRELLMAASVRITELEKFGPNAQHMANLDALLERIKAERAAWMREGPRRLQGDAWDTNDHSLPRNS